MEPLRREVREELKRVYSGLTDRDIDLYEELLSIRFTVDPDREPERLRQLDAQRARLVQEKMPRLAEIQNALALRAAQSSRASKPEPSVQLHGKDPSDGKD